MIGTISARRGFARTVALGVVLATLALAGVAYAWSYNKTGQRVSLLTALNRAMRR